LGWVQGSRLSALWRPGACYIKENISHSRTGCRFRPL